MRSCGWASARARCRGGVLLEVVAALAIFIGASLAVMACVDRAAEGLDRARGLQRAADLARSAMSQLEAGLGTAPTLSGPVPVSEGSGGNGVPYSGGEAADGESGWELEVQTEPSEFAGLTKVSITALRRRSGAGPAVYTYTLTQLVRMEGLNPRSAGGAR